MIRSQVILPFSLPTENHRSLISLRLTEDIVNIWNLCYIITVQYYLGTIYIYIYLRGILFGR